MLACCLEGKMSILMACTVPPKKLISWAIYEQFSLESNNWCWMDSHKDHLTWHSRAHDFFLYLYVGWREENKRLTLDFVGHITSRRNDSHKARCRTLPYMVIGDQIPNARRSRSRAALYAEIFKEAVRDPIRPREDIRREMAQGWIVNAEGRGVLVVSGYKFSWLRRRLRREDEVNSCIEGTKAKQNCFTFPTAYFRPNITKHRFTN